MRSQRRKIVLASRSPARRQILLDAGLKLDVRFADVDESRMSKETVSRYALRLALQKAEKIAAAEGNAIIIGVDTVIALGNKIYGKPANRGEAFRFLKTLSGKWHKVYSGTVVIDTLRGKTLKKVVVTKVKFACLSDDMINWYISTGEPLRVAGAYAIQWKGMGLIEAVNGCFTNVIGVSIPVLFRMLRTLKAI